MIFLLPILKSAYFMLVMPIKFGTLNAVITTDIRDRIYPCIYRSLLKNPTVLA